MKHTKGPWGLLALNSPHHVLVVRSCGKRWHTIAEVFSDNKSGDKDANAKLIASAPELLEKLGNCALQIEYLHDKFHVTGSGNAAIARAREAIRKATP